MLATSTRSVAQTASAAAVAQSRFTLTSTDLQNGAAMPSSQVYNRDKCSGGNISPQLSWHQPPPGTASYAITVFDPDAPGPGWWHWAVANIPASIGHLDRNASASGALAALGAVQARNDFHDNGYSGPCPRPGKTHRYVITVYALKVPTLRVDDDRPAMFYDHEIRDFTLASASITVTYGR